MTGYARHLDHSLLGDSRRRTAAALGWIGLVAVLVLASGWRRGLLTVGVDPLPGVVDQLAGATIVFAVVGPAIGVGYALLNGGPVVAAALSLVPRLAAVPVAGLYADADLVFALGGGALAATVAVGRLSIRSEDSPSLSVAPGLFDGAVVASVLTVLAGLLTAQLADTAGPHVSPAVEIAAASTGAAAVGLAVLWVVIGRAAVRR